MGNAAVTGSTITVKVPVEVEPKVDVKENPIVDNYEPASADVKVDANAAQAMPNADSKPDNSKKEDATIEAKKEEPKPIVPLAAEGRSWWWSRRATPKVEEVKVEEVKVETPKVEEVKVETPKVEEVKVEIPKVEIPKVETPKVETPKVEEVKVETPKIEEPKVDPKVEETKSEPIKAEPIPALTNPEAKILDETPTAGLPNDQITNPNDQITTPNGQITTPAKEPVEQARSWWSFMRRTIPKPVSNPADRPVSEEFTKEVPATLPKLNISKNVAKVCTRCQKPFEVPISNAANNLCGRAECFNDPSARRACAYCNTEFVVVGARDYRRHCGAIRCADAHAKRYIYQPTSKYSVKAIAWLNSIAAREGIYIHHAQNGGELRIPYMDGSAKRYFLADGFCEETNTVYEFYGDFWHGNPAKYNPDAVNEQAKKTFGQLYADTMHRQDIMARGHKMVTIWESDYDTQYLDSLIPIEG